MSGEQSERKLIRQQFSKSMRPVMWREASDLQKSTADPQTVNGKGDRQ
jgi:hypothetical protein